MTEINILVHSEITSSFKIRKEVKNMKTAKLVRGQAKASRLYQAVAVAFARKPKDETTVCLAYSTNK